MATSVRDILKRERAGTGLTPAELALRDMRHLFGLLEDMFSAARDDSPDDDWELIYDAIFGTGQDGAKSIQDRAKAALGQVDIRFPGYCDPDTTYEEDARAWKGAFDEAFGDVRERVAAIAEEERSHASNRW